MVIEDGSANCDGAVVSDMAQQSGLKRGGLRKKSLIMQECTKTVENSLMGSKNRLRPPKIG
jgi:hypothetical protein